MRGRVFWGSLFLLAGGLLLLRNLGWLPVPLGNLFWPLLLLLLGLWLVARSFVGGGQVKSERLSLPRDGAETVRLHVEHAAGRLVIGAGAGAGELMSGDFVGGVTSEERRQSSEAEVWLAVPSGSWFDFPFGGDGGFRWDVGLSPELTYELEINTAAGETRMDLSELKVRELLLKTGASSTLATLPSVDRGRVRVEAGVASVELQVPAGVAARIRSEAGLAEVNVDTGRFPPREGIFQSADYDGADKRLEIEIQAGVGSVKVR